MEGGADVLFRLWEIVPITGEVLINVEVTDPIELVSERTDTLESPLDLGVTKFGDSGEGGLGCWSECLLDRGVADAWFSGGGSGGRGWESLYCL